VAHGVGSEFKSHTTIKEVLKLRNYIHFLRLLLQAVSNLKAHNNRNVYFHSSGNQSSKRNFYKLTTKY
jgi:hypothetical protein